MNRDTFFASVRSRVFSGRLKQGQVDGLNAILDEGIRRGTPRNHLAYILATAYHESAFTMQPVRETLASTDDKAIAILEKAWKAGKLPWVKTAYWRKDAQGKSWLGRGLVQITHKPNYEKFGIAGNPSAAMQMPVAIRVIFDGMTKGMFTGKKLHDFLGVGVSDYYSARAIVNGDKQLNGAKIAVVAKAFEAALSSAGYAANPAPSFELGTKPATSTKQTTNWLGAFFNLVLTWFKGSQK